MKLYTGIGSRETPPEIFQLMSLLAERLALAGWTLRSGGADGADSAFEQGCRKAQGLREIYLPRKGFMNNDSTLCTVSPEAMSLAASIHPVWDRLDPGSRKLHARNCYQVLGQALDAPTDAVICWTADGCETRQERKKTTGGTATAIVLAHDRGIPVFNLRNLKSQVRLVTWLAERAVDVSDVLPLQSPPPTQGSLF